jgi:hypothetical protein
MFNWNKIATKEQIIVVVPNTGKILRTTPRAITKANFVGLSPCFNKLDKGETIFSLKVAINFIIMGTKTIKLIK